ncbi:MAG: hypothetical protein JNJ71_17185 [Rubrivivax sp.]|nr:hypothetical protein [Rubrivivax sp.]
MRLLCITLTKLLLLLLLSCGGGGSSEQATSSAALPGVSTAAPAVSSTPTAPATPAISTPAPTPASWRSTGTVPGLCCNYTALVQRDAGISFFSNARSVADDGQLYRYSCGWSHAGTAQAVLPPEQITDVGAASYKVRTVAVRHHASTGWVAVLRVGQGYPSPSGYVPALATSADGISWRYHGKLRVDGRVWPGQSDSSAFILQMHKPSTLNDLQPFENRYLIFENNLSLPGLRKKLVLAYSADGVEWRFFRDSAGEVVDLWPADAALQADSPTFPTADSVGGDIHVLVADAWHETGSPTRAHRHLCAPRGSTALKWLGDAATWRSGDKGPHIAYDAATDTLRAINAGRGYALAEASRLCR